MTCSPLLVALALASPSIAGNPPGLPAAAAAVDRGRLSLAWDAHESGLCDEVLSYTAEIVPSSGAAAEALWLRADCLSSLGRYAEAASLLEGPSGGQVQDRDRFLEEVYSDWAWELTGREQYGAAAQVLSRGLAARPGSSVLDALGDATRFRSSLREALAGARSAAPTVRLAGGEEAAVRRKGERPSGSGWVKAYPWDGDTAWVPDTTLEQWMPSLATRLERSGRCLWVRVPDAAVRGALEAAARRETLELRREDGGWIASRGIEAEFLEAAEWAFRSAVEGLGARGAAAAAAGAAKARLEGRARLAGWVAAHRGSLDLTRVGDLLSVRDPQTGRAHVFDLSAWADSYDAGSEEWQDFWADLTAELARPAGAFRCFCGRDAVLRETLIPADEPGDGGLVVVERGRGYALGFTALCPLHQQSVTAELLGAWGVTLRDAWDRARGDALAKRWDLSFERGEAGGASYLAIEGEGAAALARHPDLLLGALEAVEGREVRGASVSLVAPTASSLVVITAQVTKEREQAAAARARLSSARRGGAGARLGYRTRLRLPQTSAGVFDLRPVE